MSAIRAHPDTSSAESTRSRNPNKHVTDKQRALARAMALPGMTPAAASRFAGYNDGGGLAYKMQHDPAFQNLLRAEREAYAKTNGMTCKRVIDGFLRAVELAEVKTDSIAMTAAWREIGRLCGYYAPKVVKHEISVHGEALKQRLREMSDDELLALNRGEAEPLEGAFEVIEDGNAGPSDNIRDDLTSVR